MLERIKYATISDIYVKDLIFYDENNTEELIKFCHTNHINYLPGKDRTSIYKLINSRFIKVKIQPNLICNPYDRIFDIETLNKFKDGSSDEVMFVMEDELIKGVVHVIDYNTDFINIEFFKLCFGFEKMLRELLRKNNETNDTLIQWFKEKGETNGHWNKRYHECMPISPENLRIEENRRSELNQFQTFYLNDLIFFVASRRYVSSFFRKNLQAITSIRNWVAHSKDLATKTELDYPIYKIDKLEKFIEDANIFFKCYEELESKK